MPNNVSIAISIKNKTHSYYRPELDAIRLVAFLMVFLDHLIGLNIIRFNKLIPKNFLDIIGNISQSCFFGLSIFFFLSSFLITSLLLREKRFTKTIHIKNFYYRRILRIFPLYYISILCALILSYKISDYNDIKMFGYYSIFIGDFYSMHKEWSFSPFTPLWSISVEEQFYTILPLILYAINLERAIIVPLGAILISLISIYIQGHDHFRTDTAVWANPLTQLLFFSTGMLFSVICNKKSFNIRDRSRVMMIIAAIIAFGLSSFMFHTTANASAKSGPTLVAGYVLADIGCVATFLSLYGFSHPIPGFVLYLGKISFGLYVFHLIWLKLFEKLPVLNNLPLNPLVMSLSLIPTVISAMLSYRFLEMPFLALRKKYTYISNRPD